MFRRNLAVGGAAAMLLALVLIGAGCGGGGGSNGGTIALLLPENHTPRYEAADRPDFEAKVKSLCSDCKILYSNAKTFFLKDLGPDVTTTGVVAFDVPQSVLAESPAMRFNELGFGDTHGYIDLPQSS